MRGKTIMAKKTTSTTKAATTKKSNSITGMIMNALKIFFIQFIARKLLGRRS
jgi:hypothetical protein